MADLSAGVVIALLIAPYLAWNNFRILQKGEIFLSVELGKGMTHYTRAANPARYWLLVAFNLALFLAVAGFAIWGLIGPEISN